MNKEKDKALAKLTSIFQIVAPAEVKRELEYVERFTGTEGSSQCGVKREMGQIEHSGGESQKRSRYSSWACERRHTLPQEPPMCQCGIPKILRVVSKVGPNRGREFFACPKPIGAQCQGELQWCDQPVPPLCSCGKPKVKRRVTKSGPNTGRDFFTCPKPFIPACTSSFEGWFGTEFKGSPPKCTCGNPKVKKMAKKKGPNQGRYYLICPNPQTCEDAFEWVEPKESDFD